MESPVVTSAEMRAAEETAFARGITAEALMDEAAEGIARTICRFFPAPARCIVFAGKGNNAGDAFRVAELLAARGWAIDLRLAFPEDELGDLARKKWRDALPRVGGQAEARRIVILDGLLGLGATPPLREPIRSACREINRLRVEENAFVVAVDLPTGLDGDCGETDADCVVADVTVTIGYAKRGLVADSALDYVGRIEVVPLTELRRDELPLVRGRAEARPSEVLATAASLQHLLQPRKFGGYKNEFGRIGVVAGSRGLTGAAVLCSLGALRGGGGLVELFVPEEIYPILASTAPPEAMVKPITSYRALLEEPIDVWAIGPGLSGARADEKLALISHAPQPMVVDADGLNILSSDIAVLRTPAGPRLLTPHPGEMKRLDGAPAESRAKTAEQFCAKYPVTLLLKGSRTIVAERSRPISYNTTGNPGMATGGMGDVLTGVCAALVAQKLSLYDAARVGAWVCGRAAELAVFNGTASEQSLLPSDVVDYLGRAFRELQMED